MIACLRRSDNSLSSSWNDTNVYSSILRYLRGHLAVGRNQDKVNDAKAAERSARYDCVSWLASLYANNNQGRGSRSAVERNAATVGVGRG